MKDDQVREVETTNEMRAEIARLSRNDVLVRTVMDAADYAGMPAEDRYAVLAYHALSERAKFKRAALYYASITLRPADIAALAPTGEGEGK